MYDFNTVPRSSTGDARAETLSLLAAAFETDPAARGIYPADDDYRRHFRGFLAAFGGRAFDAGIVERDTGDLGAAMWFPPGLDPDEAAILAHVEATVPGHRRDAILNGMGMLGSLHPRAPHWYLPWIGVLPEAQGRGVGSTLLARGLARADADWLPVYLEATSRRNAALYGRHGFEVLGLVEAPDFPEVIAMWRPAPGRSA